MEDDKEGNSRRIFEGDIPRRSRNTTKGGTNPTNSTDFNKKMSYVNYLYQPRAIMVAQGIQWRHHHLEVAKLTKEEESGIQTSSHNQILWGMTDAPMCDL